MKTALLSETDGRELLIAGFATVLRLALRCSTQLQESTTSPALIQLLLSTLGLVGIFSNAASFSPETIFVDWSPQDWIDSFVATLSIGSTSPASFPLHSAIVQAILTLSRTTTLSPMVEKNERSVVQSLTDKVSYSSDTPGGRLTRFVDVAARLSATGLHSLLRRIGAAALGSAGAHRLSARRVDDFSTALVAGSFDSTSRFRSFWESLAVHWFVSPYNLYRRVLIVFLDEEDAQLPGLVLRSPMLLVLDSLKADDLGTRRAGEAWMRCSLKSYIRCVFPRRFKRILLTFAGRILDPLIFALLDLSIQQKSANVEVAGLELPILVYHQTFDQARTHHILDDLLSLTRFGGQGFVRIAKGSFLKHTLDQTLRDRVRACQ